MIVTSIDDIASTERDVTGEGFRSLRLLLGRDGLGFSLHETRIPAGGPHRWHYKHHLEACYCVSGIGILRAHSQQWWIRPGTMYALDRHDDHTFEALQDTVLISVFNPPVTGTEIHEKDGSYAKSDY